MPSPAAELHWELLWLSDRLHASLYVMTSCEGLNALFWVPGEKGCSGKGLC